MSAKIACQEFGLWRQGNRMKMTMYCNEHNANLNITTENTEGTEKNQQKKLFCGRAQARPYRRLLFWIPRRACVREIGVAARWLG